MYIQITDEELAQLALVMLDTVLSMSHATVSRSVRPAIMNFPFADFVL
jgi:hypothetical protein